MRPSVRWAAAFVVWGIGFIAGIYMLGGVLRGAAYWIVGGVMTVLFFAGQFYLGRQGQKASIRERASRTG